MSHFLGRSMRAAPPAAAVAVFLAGLLAVAGPDPVPFGNYKVTGDITNVGGTPEVDTYVAPMLVGEKVSLKVTAPGSSSLLPLLRLVDPTSTGRTPSLVVSRHGKTVAMKPFRVDKTGTWTVEIRGTNASEGAYAASFHIKGIKPFGTKKGLLGGNAPFEAQTPFEATDGALVSLLLKPIGSGEVTVTHILDPSGAQDAFTLLAAVQVKDGVSSFTDQPANQGSGTYRVEVRTTSPKVRYRLKITVKPQPRP